MFENISKNEIISFEVFFLFCKLSTLSSAFQNCTDKSKSQLWWSHETRMKPIYPSDLLFRAMCVHFDTSVDFMTALYSFPQSFVTKHTLYRYTMGCKKYLHICTHDFQRYVFRSNYVKYF